MFEELGISFGTALIVLLKTLEIKGFRGYCQKQAHRRSPFFAPFDSSSDYWFSRCVTRELRFALGVTRELLFLGISEGM